MNVKPFIPIVVAFVVLVVAGCLYGVAYYQLQSGVAKAQELATQLDSRTTELTRLADARAALSTLSSDEDALRTYSVSKDNIVPFLEQIQSIGKSLGATVEVISVGDEKSGMHQRVSLALTITGSFDAVIRTLGAIEYAPYDGVVTSATLNTIGESAVWTSAVVYSVGVSTSTPAKP